MELSYKRTGILFKILPCLLLVFTIILFCISPVFASTNTEIYSSFLDTTFTITGNLTDFPYLLEFYKSSLLGYCFNLYYCSPETRFCVQETTNSYNLNTYELTTLDGSQFHFEQVMADDLDTFLTKINELLSRTYPSDFSTGSVAPKGTLQYYRDSSSSKSETLVNVGVRLKGTDDLVFQGAPQEVVPVEQETILNTIATSMDFSQVMTEVLAILPIVLLIVISVLALRKAISLLFQVFRQA